jgi:hypothetical protein
MDAQQVTSVNVLKVLIAMTILLGLVGSFLCFLVFSREKFKTNSISIYCRALAISDSTVLIYALVLAIGFNFNIDLTAQSDLSCQLGYYIQVGMAPISIWILAAFSLDKMIHVLDKAASYGFIKKRSFQLTVVVSFGLFHCLLYIFVPIMLKLKHQSLNNSDDETFLPCNFPNIDNYRYIMGFYIFESALMPGSLMLISTVVTVKRLFQSRNNLEKSQNKVLRERKARDVKFAVNSVFLNVFSATLQIPIALQYILIIASTHSLFFMIILFLFYLNFSVTFFVHFTFNSIFRREFFLMTRIAKARIEPNTTQAVRIQVMPNKPQH